LGGGLGGLGVGWLGDEEEGEGEEGGEEGFHGRGPRGVRRAATQAHGLARPWLGGEHRAGARVSPGGRNLFLGAAG
jgi:hypothetical protein